MAHQEVVAAAVTLVMTMSLKRAARAAVVAKLPTVVLETAVAVVAAGDQ